jgi:hypothetical protein
MEVVTHTHTVWAAAGGILFFPLFASSLLPSGGTCPEGAQSVDYMLGAVVAWPMLLVLLVVLGSIVISAKPIGESRQLGIIVIKITSALIFCSAIVTIVVEFLSRTTMLAILAVHVSIGGLCFSHGIELWLNLEKEQHEGGLVRFLDADMQKLLLHASWMDFWTDPNMGDSIAYYVNLMMPFFFKMNREETARAISRMPENYRKKVFRHGLVFSMPEWVQTLLLPAKEKLKKTVDPSTTLVYKPPDSEAPKPPDTMVDELVQKTIQTSVQKALIPKQIDWKSVGMPMTAVFVIQWLVFTRARQSIYRHGRVASVGLSGLAAAVTMALAYWQSQVKRRAADDS